MFIDRRDAGKRLASKLIEYKDTGAIVYALPRGGVPVGFAISQILSLPLDIVITRKVGHPMNKEYAICAVTEDGERVCDKMGVQSIDKEWIDLESKVQQKEAHRRRIVYKGNEESISARGKVAILVDDGVATGLTMEAAIRAIQKQQPQKIVVAVPVISEDTAKKLMSFVDELVALEVGKPFLGSVGQYYRNFPQINDDEVIKLLNKQYKNQKRSDTKRTATHSPGGISMSRVHEELLYVAQPLEHDLDLDSLMNIIGDARIVMLGEASHGTHEYYGWRAAISKRLIQEKGFDFIAVEGDWPDCFEVNQYIKGHQSKRSPHDVLDSFNRWPTWMWANWEVARLVSWLKNHNDKLSQKKQVGFYGLDVYSLWDSLRAVSEYLKEHNPESLPIAERAYKCFEPYGGEPYDYAHAVNFVPESCENEVLKLLTRMRQVRQETPDGEELMSAEQNVFVVRNAEHYYRIMLRGNQESWNIRDIHMMNTLVRLLDSHGSDSKAIIWAHNTHIGDARATNMVLSEMVNIGGLAREWYSNLGVALVGFGSYQGQVIAARSWDAPMQHMDAPPAPPESWDGIMHTAFGGNRFLDLTKATDVLAAYHGQRAIGVVYHPERESGNYVPTSLARRYDAFLYVDETTALKPFHLHPKTDSDFPETYPYGV